MTDFKIVKGSTFSKVLRWEASPFIYLPITAITKASPVVITSAGHGIPDGWRVAVASAGGMRQLNAKQWPPRASDFHKCTVLSSSTIALNDVNSADYTAYTSGGSIVHYTPVDLAGYTARMMIRSTPNAVGAPLVSLVSPTDIVIDNTAKTITITIAADVTDDFTWNAGTYDLELVSGSVVTRLLSGNVTTEDETTR